MKFTQQYKKKQDQKDKQNKHSPNNRTKNATNIHQGCTIFFQACCDPFERNRDGLKSLKLQQKPAATAVRVVLMGQVTFLKLCLLVAVLA